MSEPNALDKVIGYFSPAAAAKRHAARLQLTALRGYNAAHVGRRTQGWRATATGPNEELRAAGSAIRNRARELERNTPHGRRAINAITQNTVGAGIVGTIKVAGKETAATKAKRERIHADWQAWANSVDADAGGRLNFYGLQSLAMRAIVRDGEVLARRVIRNRALSVQILEADQLATELDQYSVGGLRMVQGVKVDEYGRAVAYRVYTDHPGETGSVTKAGYSTVEIPAAEIAHVYKVTRPGQLRGEPWMHAVAVKLRDLADYEDATLLRQKIGNAFAAFVYDTTGNMTSGLANTDATDLIDTIEPGSVEVLPPGRDVKFSNPPGVNDYDPFRLGQLHDVATGLDVPYSILTGDLRQVNFSSGRMGWLEFNRAIDDWRWNMLIPMFCDRVFNWWLDLYAIRTGENIAGVSIEWTPPKREMVDPTREIKAKIEEVRGGLITLPEAIRETGADPMAVLAEIEAFNTAMDSAGVILDSDPRRTTQQGLSQAKQTSAGGGVEFPA